MKSKSMSLLTVVRNAVLEERVRHSTPRVGFGLSWITSAVGAPKNARGHVQACLAVLAREGIMYGRNHPERGVQRYEHGETDKRFIIRITRSEALRRLKKNGTDCIAVSLVLAPCYSVFGRAKVLTDVY